MATERAVLKPEGPVPLVTVDEATNRFVVTPEAIEYLRSLDPRRRLAVVSIAGGSCNEQ
jgi:hypothetical protein